MKILYLKEQIMWFGGHTGYGYLNEHMPASETVWTVKMRQGQAARYLGSAYARLQGRYGRGATSLSEFEFCLQRKFRRPDASHLLNVENNLELLRACSRTDKDVIATVHLPAAIWSPDQCQLLSNLHSVIALYQRDIPFFEQYVGRDNVRFIHHGADTDFFKPDPAKVQTPPRILYGGVYLRNEPMLVRVVERLAEKLPELRFDLLVPQHHRKGSALGPLADHPAVTWHAGLNDDQLRGLYQRSHLLLIPLNNSGANTAIVEALASGLPVVTTDVGGIRDYGGDDIFPVVANNDDDAMVALVEHYVAKPDHRNEVGRSCRKFAEEKLAWPVVAQRHLEVYRNAIA